MTNTIDDARNIQILRKVLARRMYLLKMEMELGRTGRIVPQRKPTNGGKHGS